MATTSNSPTPQVSQDDSATIPSLVVTNFFNNATPQLAKLADLSAFAQVQYSYYSSLGVGQPILGPYEAIGRAFAEEASFQSKYGSLGSNFIATAYQDVFGRAAGTDQVAHFQAQIDYFVSIYVKAGISSANALSYAQGAVIGQMLGHAVTEGGSIFDYAGAAKAYIAQIGTAGFVPGRPLSNFGEGGTTTPPATGGGGGGGGGGSTGPAPVGASVDVNKILQLNANDTYKLSFAQNGDMIVSRAGTTDTLTIAANQIDPLTGIAIQQSTARVEIKGADVSKLHELTVSGAGKFNVSDVTISGKPFTGVPDLSDIGFSNVGANGFLAANLLVNGNKADAFATLWFGLDKKYYEGPANGPVQTNQNFVKLANDYVDYLKDNNPIDISAKYTTSGNLVTREQTLHDNLLGNITDYGVNQRFNSFSQNPNSGYPTDIRSDDAKLYGARPLSIGDNIVETRKALAWDFSKALHHDNYVMHYPEAKIDVAGRFDGGDYLNFNLRSDGTVSGNTADGFQVVRHEGAGIELGLKAKAWGGADFQPVAQQDDKATYSVMAGSSPLTTSDRAAWSFDFSVLTGLNGRSGDDLSKYKFEILVDTDASASTSYQIYDLLFSQTGVTPWLLRNSGVPAGFADSDGTKLTLSQNSVNFGFGFIKSAIDGDPLADGQQPYTYGAGQFDIQLVAYDTNGVKLVGTHIVVHVDGMGLAP